MARRKAHHGFYDKPFAARMSQRIFEGLLSTAAIYLLAPSLIKSLAPLQSQINADAINTGNLPTNQGVNSVANALIKTVTPEDLTKVGS